MPHKQKPTQGRYGCEWHDGKAPDGFTVNGWRRIAKGGYIRCWACNGNGLDPAAYFKPYSASALNGKAQSAIN